MDPKYVMPDGVTLRPQWLDDHPELKRQLEQSMADHLAGKPAIPWRQVRAENEAR